MLLFPRWFGLWVGGASSAGWVEPGLGPVLALPCSAAALAFCGGKEQERGGVLMWGRRRSCILSTL